MRIIWSIYVSTLKFQRLLSILESIPWNLLSLNCGWFCCQSNEFLVLMNSSAFILAFVYLTSIWPFGLDYFLKSLMFPYLVCKICPAASPKLLLMIPPTGVYGLFALPYEKASEGKDIPLLFFKAETPNGILASCVCLYL